jgi:CRP/FNR family transcriptional regulator, nitrogen fixation regulation protein
MLTEAAYQDGSSGHLFDRAARMDLPARSRAVGDSIELLGAPISFARNAEIYGEKEPADSLYKVLSGTVRSCRALIDGRRQVGAFYLPGDTFGLESGDEHVFSAEAVVDAKLLVVDRTTLAALAARDKEVARQLWALMSRELQHAQDHVLLLVKTAHERVVSFLLEMAERIRSSNGVELPMSRQDIADYLGLTIETVSRMLTQLENASVIAVPTSKRIVLRDRELLQRLVA